MSGWTSSSILFAIRHPLLFLMSFKQNSNSAHPDDRERRRLRRAALREANFQAVSSVSMTGNKSRNPSKDNMHVPAPNNCVDDVVNKTPSNLQPELPHRPDPCGQPSESPDSDLKTENFYHGTRSRISSDPEQNKKRKIKYPSSNDPIWVKIQEGKNTGGIDNCVA